MSEYCQIGDIPTVYYIFGESQQWQTVTFHMAPIAVEVEDSRSNDSGGSGGAVHRVPCPESEGKICSVRYSALFRFKDSYELEPGQCHVYGSGGWGFQECYISWIFADDPNYEFNASDFGFIWRVTASSSYIYRKSVPRPAPTEYMELVNDGNALLVEDWILVADSCFPNGGDPETCYNSSDSTSNPNNQNQEKISKLKIFYKGQNIWQNQGKSPCTYKVSCKKDECPPDLLKLPATNTKGFCCIHCQEIKAEVSQIKALLRQRNG